MNQSEIFARNCKCYSYARGIGTFSAFEEAGLSGQTYQLIRKGYIQPTWSTVYVMSEYFGLTEEEMMAEDIPAEILEYDKYTRLPKYKATMDKELAITDGSRARQLDPRHLPWYKDEKSYPCTQCKKCIYYRKTGHDRLGTCAYIDITGHIKELVMIEGQKATINSAGECVYFVQGKSLYKSRSKAMTIRKGK